MSLLKANAWFWRNGFSISYQVKKEMQLIFLKNKIFTLAESLGGVESLANYSVMMATHRFRKIKERLQMI
jgi:cystathionine beta-lyase/cystathionine gamma-synthase